MQKRFELGRESLILRKKIANVVHNLLLETVAAVSWELKSLRSGRGEGWHSPEEAFSSFVPSRPGFESW